ncbi:S-adenosyl-L-methionine-dependent methyltransferase [Endogone sp. FLAS-F59071]|nr:S-adenosyl-L-methionine-dependent methyltransferase [Endogone sp. FLAS-F59071]|eukprot:RUS16450.1 S-adenosyl-L-methionine-dependent methyltransferase [Endogone sp. FLAS-F59071]
MSTKDNLSYPQEFKVRKLRQRSAASAKTSIIPPNDGMIDRMNFAHYIMRYINHGNFSAPVEDKLEDGIRVIDVGCGSGIWTMEMARDFPASTFIGMDIAETFPKTNLTNCSFIRADALKRLPFADETFDYVFMRFMYLSFTPEDWVTVVGELVRLTKPGGWVELFDSDLSIEQPPPSYVRFMDALTTCTLSRGIDLKVTRKLGELLRAASLKDVESDYVSQPVGWHGRAGVQMGEILVMIRKAMRTVIAPVMAMTDDEYDQWAVTVGKEMREHRSWTKAFYAYGVKP